MLLMSSCGLFNNRLKKDDLRLMSNRIVFVNTQHLQNKSQLKIELAAHYKQKPKTLTQDPFDLKPVLWNQLLMDSTRNEMARVLQNKGYLYASVEDNADKNNKENEVTVTYTVNPGVQFVLDTVTFFSPDPDIQAILDSIKPGSLLKSGDPLNGKTLGDEKARIRNFLNNNGYAQFTPNYFNRLEGGDSSIVVFDAKGNRKINIILSISNPSEFKKHQRFKVGKITVNPSFNPILGDVKLLDSLKDNIHFVSLDGQFGVKLNVLRKAIRLKPGEYYSKDNEDKTLKQINKLSIYKFPNYKVTPDPNDSTVYNFQYNLIPQKKMVLGGGPEINYSFISGGTGLNRYPGISLEGTFEHRNLFKGAEHFTSTLSVGTDFGTFLDARAGVSLNIPKYFKFPGHLKAYKNLHLISKKFYEDVRENGSTSISASFNYTKRLDYSRITPEDTSYLKPTFDNYSSFDLSYKYQLETANYDKYSITPIGIVSFASFIPDSSKFSLVLEKNLYLKKSLSTQLSTGFLFRGVTYAHDPPYNEFGIKRYWGMRFEQSGSEIVAANALYNLFSSKNDTFRLSNDFNFSKYLRLELESRYTKQWFNKTEVAFRAIGGIAPNLSGSVDVPYLRQFYAGGQNSLRGWGPRGIGPGGYRDIATLTNNGLQYQTGDIRLEVNAEYRFPVWWVFQSAVFLDYGNIWTINKDPQRPFSQFEVKDLQFLKQTALSTGIGLRVDLSYFLFRLDFGFPLYRPQNESGYFVGANESIRSVNYNFALGLPF